MFTTKILRTVCLSAVVGLLLCVFLSLVTGCSEEQPPLESGGDTTATNTIPSESGPDETEAPTGQDTSKDETGAESEVETPPEIEDNSFGSIREILASYHDPNGRTMSCAHRAIISLDSSFPENSLDAIRACIEAGVDIVEIDVKRTADGEYVLCHDSTLSRTTTYTGSAEVSAMTYREIRRYPLLEYTGSERNVYKDADGKNAYVPKLTEVLELVRNECMVNFDQFYLHWDNRMELYRLVMEAGCLPNVIFKGSFTAEQISVWHNEIKLAYGEDAVMPLFTVVYSNENEAEYRAFVKTHIDGGKTTCIESSFSRFGTCLSDPALMGGIRRSMRTFINLLTESLGSSGYCAGMLENATGWMGAEACGYNIIQTNNAADCAAFIRRKYGPKELSAEDKNSALYVSRISTAPERPHIAVGDDGLAITGDVTLFYDRVDFGSGKDGALILNVASTHPSGRITVFTEAEPQTVLTTVELSEVYDRVTAVTVQLAKACTGVQTLCFRLEGLSDGQTVQFEDFTYSDAGLGDVVAYEEVFLFSREGAAPVLPSQVIATTTGGYRVAMDVSWASIPEAYYRTAPARFTVPGRMAATGETVSAQVEITAFDTADVLVWYQAGQGMETDDKGRVISWTDRVNGIVATTETEGSRPGYADGLLVFDGKDDHLVFDTALNGRNELTIVLGSRNAQSTKQYNSSFAFSNGPRHALLMFPESGPWGSVWFSTFTDAASCRFGTGADGNRGFVYTAMDGKEWTVSAAVKDRMQENLYLDGKLVYKRAEDSENKYCTPGTGATIGNTCSYAYIGLGIQSDTRYFYKGTASDILLFQTALSDEEIARVSAYLRGIHDGTISMVDYGDELQGDW